MDFKIGDTVRLKSGGPLMTVKETSGDQVRCQWFDEKHSVQTHLFLAAMLEADDGTIHIG
jgi:uncharacterized protein YodC (DUF2158 family)